MINEVLDLAKVEAGNLELYATDINLPDLLQEVVDIMQTRAKAKGLHFSSEWLSNIPTMVIADERRIRQVLVNLLDNAIKYSDRGTVVLKVGHHNDCLRFLIEDTGIGIRTEDLKNIFNIFHQVHHQKRVEQGTWLGLAICQRLVNLMGGTLQVTSVPGEGACNL
ncbi:MAG: hypothetical protein GY807_00200 [Gammaproteobacteria bacterium]|nr:hypothetical protein [Gammaproteobacteria bacterium]